MGDWVLLSLKDLRSTESMPKQSNAGMGPFQVVNRVATQGHEAILPSRWEIIDVVHASNLERYRWHGLMQPPPSAEVLREADNFGVDSVVDHRVRLRRASFRNSPTYGTVPVNFLKNYTFHRTRYPYYGYLVRWKGHSPRHNTWEPEANLINAPLVIKGYWDAVNARAPSAKGQWVS